MKNVDSMLLAKDDFRNTIRFIISSIFSIDTSYKKIYVDLNSAISIIFRNPKVINDPIVNDYIWNSIEGFLTKYSSNTEIIFLWTVQPSSIHTSIYPDWCKLRYERVQIRQCECIKKILVALANFSKKNKLIKVINVKDIHPAIIVRHLELPNRKHKCVVLSKDTVFQCLNLNNVIIFTGAHYIDFSDEARHLPDDLTGKLDNPSLMLPYYLAIRGDNARNEYKGISGYGVMKTLKYLKLNELEINADIEHDLKEDVDKYVVLFNTSKLYDMTDKEHLATVINGG